MSSQGSEGDHYVADPKIFREIYPYLWASEEEGDTDLEEIVDACPDANSEEEDVPLPQPGDMHVEFQKSSLPKRYKPEVQFIPSRFLQESRAALCKKILKLELENDDLREEIFMLKYKLKKKASSPPPSSSPPPKET